MRNGGVAGGVLMAETIWVAPHPSLRAENRVALYERHPAHPGGAIAIDGADGPTEVAETPGVLFALAPPGPGLAPQLVRLDGAALRTAQEEHAARQAQRAAEREAARATQVMASAPTERDRARAERDREQAERRAEEAEARAAELQARVADLEAKQRK
jgi:hypothetical protein